MPLWRVRGHGDFMLAGQRLRFHGVGRWPYNYWSLPAHKGVWEPVTLARFASELRPGDTVVDVGAGIGAYTLLASRLTGRDGRVIAFEPHPGLRELLRRNVVFEGAAHVTIRSEAVSDSSGSAWLRASPQTLGTSTVAEVPTGIPIATATLDDFCSAEELEPDVLKIDVEGGEAAVLAGAQRVLADARALFLEIHEPQLARLEVDAAELLRSLGDSFDRIDRLDDREPGNYNVVLRKNAGFGRSRRTTVTGA